MKVYKVTLCILDFDELGPDEISIEIENVNYPNRSIYPKVVDIDSREIGEWWDDDHPLNHDPEHIEFLRMFSEPRRPSDRRLEEEG